ncbi:SDR family NAD(P)-dependent oxidoreductase [Mesorhizobium atlanticum]
MADAATNRLEGSVILIAGAASGIGAAIARRCITEGAKVVSRGLRSGAGNQARRSARACRRRLPVRRDQDRIRGSSRRLRREKIRPARRAGAQRRRAFD